MHVAFALLAVFVTNIRADENEAAKNRPVTKVINLLKDMVKQLEKEGEEDEEIFEKMGCWCVTNEKSKTKSIADAETQVEDLSATIEALTAESSELTTKIGALKKEVAKNEEALETATANREQEAADFNKFEKSQIVAIEQLKGAVLALSKAHDAALLQGNQKSPTKPRGPSPVFAREIETEALKAHMHGLIQYHPHAYLTALMQVSQKTMKASRRKEVLTFLKGNGAEEDDGDDDDGDLPDHMPGFSVPTSLPHVQRGVPHLALLNRGSAVLRWAKRFHKVDPDATADLEPPPSDQTAFRSFPPQIQALLSHALSGVDTALLQAGTAAPASGEIFGVLKQMRENEEGNLKQAREAEAKAGADYDALKKAKEDEIKTGSEQVDTMSQQLAAADEKKAESTEILEETQGTLDVDKKFLADLKVRCGNMDAEFEERKVNRQNEIEAVSKALAFLSSDEAHELFTRTFNPVFIQRTSQRVSRSNRMFTRLLHKFAMDATEPSLSVQLAMMAAQVHDNANSENLNRKMNPAFKAVNSELTKMIKKLEGEQKQEMKKRDYCIEALDQNSRDQEMKTRDKKDLNAALEDLELTIETLDKEIETLKKDIIDLQKEMKEAKTNREKENKEFENTVADQRATAKLLKAALGILQKFYGKAALLQTIQYTARDEIGQAPPPGFAKAKKSAASGGVMGMMQGIIDEAKAMEEEAVRAEEGAQKDYDDFKMETEEAIEQKTEESETKQSDKAQAEKDNVQKEKELEDAMTEFETLENEAHDLHKECDFLMENFHETQEARHNEIIGLQDANMIFKTDESAAFLQ